MRPLQKAIVMMLTALQITSACASQAQLTASDLSKQIDAKGAKTVVDSFGDGFDDVVLDHIDKGESEWVALAPRLAAGTDAGNSESLTISLAFALPKNPSGVLAVLTDGNGILSASSVCTLPFIEGTIEDPATYQREAIKAVGAVQVPKLDHARSACLSGLQSIKLQQ